MCLLQHVETGHMHNSARGLMARHTLHTGCAVLQSTHDKMQCQCYMPKGQCYTPKGGHMLEQGVAKRKELSSKQGWYTPPCYMQLLPTVCCVTRRTQRQTQTMPRQQHTIRLCTLCNTELASMAAPTKQIHGLYSSRQDRHNRGMHHTHHRQ